MVFHWSLSDNKSLQVTRTLLSILTELNNAGVWMVSTCLLISKSSSCLVTVPSASITIGITVTFKFHSFSVLQLGPSFPSVLPSSLAKSSFSPVLPCGQPERQSSLFGKFSLFIYFLTITWSRHLVEMRWSVCSSKSKRILCISIF